VTGRSQLKQDGAENSEEVMPVAGESHGSAKVGPVADIRDAHPLARVRVIKVEYEDDDHAIVITDSVPSHPMWNHCERTNDGWVYTGDHN